MDLKTIITHYVANGLSVIPINPHGKFAKTPAGWLLPQDEDDDGNPLWWSKDEDGNSIKVTERPNNSRPVATWSPFQIDLPSPEWINYWHNNNIQSIAGVAGGVSGGLEVIDFDVSDFFFRWSETIPSELYDKLVIQITGSGKFQCAYRCSEIEGNRKLAWEKDSSQKSGRMCAIETRGEGGYFLLPPSPHPDGGIYTLLQGKFSQINTITQDERKLLIDTAVSLCRAPFTKQQLAKQERDRNRPPRDVLKEQHNDKKFEKILTWYNQITPIDSVLIRHGYTRVSRNTYSRPGKRSSMGVYIIPNTNKTFNWSSNDDMVHDRDGGRQPADPFDYRTHYEFNGDYGKCFAAIEKEYNEAHVEQTAREYMLPKSEGIDPRIPLPRISDANIAIITMSEKDRMIIRDMELGIDAIYHPDPEYSWSNGSRTEIISVPEVYVLIDDNHVDTGKVIKSKIRRANIIRLPDGLSNLSQIGDYNESMFWLCERIDESNGFNV